jgi:lactate dehydrogenase-like 2-hydroxyacid dehydrogenase
MKKKKLLLTRRWPSVVEQKLSEFFDLTINEQDIPLSQTQLSEALTQFDAICPTVTDLFSKSIFRIKNKRCRILANFGVGFNHIDVAEACLHDIVVTNTPGVLTETTADLAMTLLLMVARRAGEGERLIRSEKWNGWSPTNMLGTDVQGACLGIIGYGRIGQAVAQRAYHGFGMNIIYFNPRPIDKKNSEKVEALACESLDDLLIKADFISMHCPGGEKTRHMINSTNIGLIKSSAFIINCARGDVLDSEALIQSLQNKSIAGAGLDVFENEPQLDKRLLGLENVTLLPHLGSATLNTRIAMGEIALKNLVAFFSGQSVLNQIL